tara:strand:+ start:43077 stop:43250 length:174 start_codon:yes stop_codon:yes gene_type:complete
MEENKENQEVMLDSTLSTNSTNSSENNEPPKKEHSSDNLRKRVFKKNQYLKKKKIKI